MSSCFTSSGDSGAGMKIGLSAIRQIPYKLQRYNPRDQNFILLGCLQTLLHLVVAPVRARVEHFKVNHAPGLLHRIEADPVGIGHAGDEQDPLPLDTARVPLQENGTPDPARQPRHKFHWVVALEAQVHIPMKIPAPVNRSEEHTSELQS